MAGSLDYPTLRQSRTGPPPGGVSTTSTTTVSKPIPRVRLWTGYIGETGVDNKGIVASPRFTGPAVITHMNCFQRRSTSDNIPYRIGLWKNVSQYTSANSLAAAAPTAGVSLFESDFTVDTGFPPVNVPGFLGIGLDTGHQTLFRELRVPVLDPEFYLAVTYIPWSAAASHVSVMIRVVEGLAPEDIPSFL